MRYYIALIAIAAIGISIFTACRTDAPATNTARTNTADAPKTNSAAPAEDPLKDVPRISLEDAKKAFDEGNAVFVDTRAEIQHRQSRITGALSIPAEAFATRYAEVPRGKKIITYCS